MTARRAAPQAPSTSTPTAAATGRGADRPVAPSLSAGLALPVVALALVLAAGVLTGQAWLALVAVVVPAVVVSAGIVVVTRRARARSTALASATHEVSLLDDDPEHRAVQPAAVVVVSVAVAPRERAQRVQPSRLALAAAPAAAGGQLPADGVPVAAGEVA